MLRLLTRAPLGHISSNCHDAQNLARGAPDNGGREFHRDDPTILREGATRQQYIVPGKVPLLARTREPSPVGDAIGFWRDEVQGLSDGLYGPVTEHPLGRQVPQADHPSTIREDDGVRSARNQLLRVECLLVAGSIT